ncbi:hypothetical protein B0H17DRAFT_1182753 [Mycena rosella]|uniref:Uncharacterized protein n=1 Tax=Mycena rosella TaxID=1033263 RepID=A0AAD7D3J0_MYCRO|nr:hypothetical protein B0H17DRAFT_1182753 [Mycena rosella]
MCETPANPHTRKYTVLHMDRRKRSCKWIGTGTHEKDVRCHTVLPSWLDANSSPLERWLPNTTGRVVREVSFSGLIPLTKDVNGGPGGALESPASELRGLEHRRGRIGLGPAGESSDFRLDFDYCTTGWIEVRGDSRELRAICVAFSFVVEEALGTDNFLCSVNLKSEALTQRKRFNSAINQCPNQIKVACLQPLSSFLHSETRTDPPSAPASTTHHPPLRSANMFTLFRKTAGPTDTTAEVQFDPTPNPSPAPLPDTVIPSTPTPNLPRFYSLSAKPEPTLTTTSRCEIEDAGGGGGWGANYSSRRRSWTSCTILRAKLGKNKYDAWIASHGSSSKMKPTLPAALNGAKGEDIKRKTVVSEWPEGSRSRGARVPMAEVNGGDEEEGEGGAAKFEIDADSVSTAAAAAALRQLGHTDAASHLN